MDTGTVFNIQKFSIHDGPGIRTVIFFKGCPLKCQWCANPESQNIKQEILWDEKKCAGCKTCIFACPHNAVRCRDSRIFIDSANCTYCSRCITSCPNSALTLEGEVQSVSEIVEECMKDQAFYDQSGGGITLSGGEVLLQADFATRLLKTFKEQNLHTAVETSGYSPADEFTKLLPYLDLILFDMKHWDTTRHLEGTGVSNEWILQNMELAIEAGKEVLPRIPVIPLYNDNLEDAREFAKKLLSLGASKAQLLPFHQLGQSKYDLLGRDYQLQDLQALHEEDLEQFRLAMCEEGVHAFF